jgi:plasmid stabilization system protein ParE
VKPPIFRPAAAADVEDAYRWYEDHRAGLGDEFLAVVNTVIKSLLAYPERFPVVYRETRRVNLRRFPYSIFYRIIDDQVMWWLACMDDGTHGGGNLATNG